MSAVLPDIDRLAAGDGVFGPVDVEAARVAIETNGYTIVPDVVPADYLETVRAFWLEAFSKPVKEEPIIWAPYFGEPNKLVYQDTVTHCMFRSYDYYWNPALHEPTRALGLHLSRVRNMIVETNLYEGETFSPERYGIYMTATYYPPGKGWLHGHEDGVRGHRHWHHMVPLTFKGADYKGGGLYLIDRHGDRIDVDDHVSPGDVIFFDANLKHGVDPIEPLPEKNLGRLQCFAIPTLMELPEQNDRSLEIVSIPRFAKVKLRQLKYKLFGVPASKGAYRE